MKHLFIINAKSHKETRQTLIQNIRHVYQGLDFAIELTEYPTHATKIAASYAALYPSLRIYACGGDGTIHEVVNGIYPHRHVELAVIPIGTGNDFVKSLDIKKEYFFDLKRYLSAKIHVIDLILVKHEVSINTVSLGLDVKIAQNVDKFKHLPGPKGIVPYYLSLLYSMSSSLSEIFSFQLDERNYQKAPYTFIVFGNGQYYGGGFRPCPTASLHDGSLNYCLIQDVSRAKILTLAHHYKAGTHPAFKRYVSCGTMQKAKILNTQPVTICLDGEIRTMVQPEICILPQVLPLALPKA